MALGNLTYKTINKIAIMKTDLTAKAGYCLKLTNPYTVDICGSVADRPYAVVTVGAPSITGTYPGQVLAGSLEIVDAYGAVVVAMAGGSGVTFGAAVEVFTDGTFQDVTGGAGDWIAGYALSDAAAGESFLLSFTPVLCCAEAPTPPAP